MGSHKRSKVSLTDGKTSSLDGPNLLQGAKLKISKMSLIMSKNVSKEDLRKVNRIYKVAMFSIAAALAIGALIYNPFHLATAGLIVAYTLSSEFVAKEDGGISYE
jgi:hypothetical protein